VQLGYFWKMSSEMRSEISTEPSSLPSDPRPTRSRKIVVTLLVTTSVLLASCLGVLLFVKQKMVTVNHTVPSIQTRYINAAPMPKWEVGACVRDTGGHSYVPVNCSSAFDFVLVSETTDENSCVRYSTNGGMTYQWMSFEGSSGRGFFCAVP